MYACLRVRTCVCVCLPSSVPLSRTRTREQVSEEAAALRLRLKALKLDNDAVWKREEVPNHPSILPLNPHTVIPNPQTPYLDPLIP